MQGTCRNCAKTIVLFSVGLLGVTLPSSVDAADRDDLSSGIERSEFDEATRPQDDFFRYVNGGWIDRNQIPADKSRWGSFDILREESFEHQREIIEQLATETHPDGSEQKKIVDLYNSLMDESLANELGVAPVQSWLDRIDQITNIDELVETFADLERSGVVGPMSAYISIDSHNSQEYAVYIRQAGLGLPNRNYYIQEGEKFQEIRNRYPEYIATLFSLAGLDNHDERARAVYELESKMAEVQWSPEDSRDATKTDNPFAVDELDRLTDQIGWSDYLSGKGLADRIQRLYVRETSYIEKLGGLLHDIPIDDWKNYLRFHVLNDAAPWLSNDFEQANFEFFGALISGQEEMEPRWLRAVKVVNSVLGEAVGKTYVKKHFAPAAKERMDELVSNLLAAFETSIQELDWMTDETKQKAEVKRTRLTTKIGYPDEWKDYSTLEIESNDAIGNIARYVAWDYKRELARLGEPVDRKEWHMTPQTVNAYHNPRMNEIVFPAAILQPPFFNAEADDAVNYGGIGVVIGHEIGHAFDDQGRKTDGNGNLNDWWTDEDAAAFKAKAQALVDQFSEFQPLPDLNVNGQLTLGENIGDLTGLYISYKAYKMSLDGEEAPVIDGLTGDQRFFLGYAQIWRSKYRDEAVRRQVLTDPHSPPHFRVIGPLRNFGPFYEAFNVKPGDKMYLDEKNRIQIW